MTASGCATAAHHLTFNLPHGTLLDSWEHGLHSLPFSLPPPGIHAWTRRLHTMEKVPFRPMWSNKVVSFLHVLNIVLYRVRSMSGHLRPQNVCYTRQPGLWVWVWHGYKMSYPYPYPYIPMGQTWVGIETHANHYLLYRCPSAQAHGGASTLAGVSNIWTAM